MISLLIVILYATLILIYLFTSFFIVYHLSRYSIHSEMKIVMLILFVVISAGLLFSNLALFFSLNWNSLISKFLS